jgi:hypothetical protein
MVPGIDGALWEMSGRPGGRPRLRGPATPPAYRAPPHAAALTAPPQPLPPHAAAGRGSYCAAAGRGSYCAAAGRGSCLAVARRGSCLAAARRSPCRAARRSSCRAAAYSSSYCAADLSTSPATCSPRGRPPVLPRSPLRAGSTRSGHSAPEGPVSSGAGPRSQRGLRSTGRPAGQGRPCRILLDPADPRPSL